MSEDTYAADFEWACERVSRKLKLEWQIKEYRKLRWLWKPAGIEHYQCHYEHAENAPT